MVSLTYCTVSLHRTAWVWGRPLIIWGRGADFSERIFFRRPSERIFFFWGGGAKLTEQFHLGDPPKFFFQFPPRPPDDVDP